ncbi:MAG: amidohydrolase family protein, partial [Planctomycetota bacterium]
MTKKALRARVVYPVAAPPIEDGLVVFEEGRVTRIGRQAPADVEVEDLGDVALLPGLVNAHCHLEFSGLRRKVGRTGLPLPAWIRQVIEKRPAGKKVGKAIEDGLEESLVSGVTTVAEICRTETDAYRIEGQAPRLLLLQESIGFSQARAGSALNAAENRLEELHALVDPKPNGAANGHNANGASNGSGGRGSNGQGSNGHGPNGVASYADAIFADPDRPGSPNDWFRIGVSPHAPYTASPQLIRELVSVAIENEMPVAMHLAESPEELQLLAEGKGPFQEILEERGMWDPWVIGRGSAPLDYLRMLTRAPKALVVHGNYLDHSELAMMGRHGGAMSLCYCPRTHAHFKHKPYPLAEALELGVRVCLGTDGRGSTPDLSMLEEMREAHAKHPHV